MRGRDTAFPRASAAILPKTDAFACGVAGRTSTPRWSMRTTWSRLDASACRACCACCACCACPACPACLPCLPCLPACCCLFWPLAPGLHLVSPESLHTPCCLLLFCCGMCGRNLEAGAAKMTAAGRRLRTSYTTWYTRKTSTRPNGRWTSTRRRTRMRRGGTSRNTRRPGRINGAARDSKTWLKFV